jgi:hypothetical protein
VLKAERSWFRFPIESLFLIIFFNLLNPSKLTVALVLTRALREISTTILHGRKGRPALKADNLTAHLLADCLENVGFWTSDYIMVLHGLLWGF